MNRFYMTAIVLVAVVGVSGCANFMRALGGSRATNEADRKAGNAARSDQAKSKFLMKQAPDSEASFQNWMRDYERARGSKEVDTHYLKIAPKNVEMFIAKGKGLQAHYAARKIGYHSRHQKWTLKSQAPVELAKKAAAARAAEAQKMYDSIKRYAEVNAIGCVASSKALPEGNKKITDLVFHTKIGQRLFVRCFMPTRIASMMSGKPQAALRGEINTTDQNLQNCGGYSCYKDPDMSYHYRLATDVAKFARKDYFDFVFNTARSPDGKSTTKDDFGAIQVTGSLYWVTKIQERFNKKTQAWEKVPVYDQVKGVTTLSYEN